MKVGDSVSLVAMEEVDEQARARRMKVPEFAKLGAVGVVGKLGVDGLLEVRFKPATQSWRDAGDFIILRNSSMLHEVLR